MQKYTSVVYVQGGCDRFRWSYTVASMDKALTLKRLEEVRKQGYNCFVATSDITGKPINGLPETFSCNDSVSDFELRQGWYVRNGIMTA
jgi:hypothetical protein